MKIKSLVSSFGFLGCAAFLAVAPVNAGPMMAPMDTGPVQTAPISNLLDPIETTLSAGFDTTYMFRGYDLGQEAPWAGVDFSLPLDMSFGKFSLDFGLWYVNPTEGPANSAAATVTVAPPVVAPPAFNLNPKRGVPDDELDAYVGVSTTVGPVDISFGYVHYFLGPEQSLTGVATGINDQNELGLNLGTSIGPLDFGLEYAYNFDAGDSNTALVPRPGGLGLGPTGTTWQFTQYWEPSVGTGWELSDRVSLNFSVAAGFYGNQFSHWQFGLAAPIIIAENVVLEPYIAFMDDHKAAVIASPTTDDEIFGGISLSVSF